MIQAGAQNGIFRFIEIGKCERLQCCLKKSCFFLMHFGFFIQLKNAVLAGGVANYL